MKTFPYYISVVYALLTLSIGLQGQTDNATGWYNFDQAYYEFGIDSTAIYSISYDELIQAGIEPAAIQGKDLAIYSFGERIELYTTTDEQWASGDYLYFIGQHNDGRLDAELYDNPDRSQLNPLYSLYTDQSSYFLTLEEHDYTAFRYEEVSSGVDDNGLPPLEDYYIHTVTEVFTDQAIKPTYNNRDFIRYSDYDIGEGYGSDLRHEHVLKIPMDEMNPFGIDPNIKIRVATNVFSRSVSLLVNGELLRIRPTDGYTVVEFDERIDPDLLRGDTIEIAIQTGNGENERSSIGFYELAYSRRYVFDDIETLSYTQQASLLPRNIEISNSQEQLPLLINTTAKQIVTPQRIDQGVQYVVPSSFSTADWFYQANPDDMLEVREIAPITFEQQTTDAYTIITHDAIMDAAETYGAYRSSPQGGQYDVAIVDMDQLRCQYAFGIEHHPIALKRFLAEAMQGDQAIDYVFLLGKSLEYTSLREETDDVSYVPTWGVPGSDNLLVAREGDNHPAIPIGRLSAETEEAITDYLDKIRVHEAPREESQTYEDQNWKKQIIHLSGGSSDIQNLLFNFLNDMGDVIGNRTFGADLLTFRKTSSDPIQTATSEQIINAINGGSSIISFFGHSAVGTFDFSLEDPSKYKNAGRNPIILSLGCHSGNIHTGNTGISEDFVLEKDNGATIFLASSGTAYINPQYNMGLDLYDLIGEDMYGEPIGNVLQRALEMRADRESLSIETLIQQFTLHGDPAYRPLIFDGPDYVVDNASVRVNPDVITASSESITIDYDIINLGRAVDAPLDVMLVHQYNEGRMLDTIMTTISAPPFRSSISVEITNPGFDAIGQNKIFIYVDPQDDVEELPDDNAERNNRLFDNVGQEGFDFFVFDKSASPVSPADFAIVNDPNVELIASINNAFDFGGRYELQIDTTELFDSPLLRAEIVDNNSSQISWRPNMDLQAGTVYYWRIATEEVDLFEKSRRWRTQSFIFLPDSQPGWSQSHFYQWQKDDFYKLRLDDADRRVHYAEREWDIRIKNQLRDPNDFWVFVNNSPWASLNARSLAPAIQVFAWHPEQVIIANSGRDFGSESHSVDGFIFKTDTPEGRQGLIELLDFMPDGSRVFLHTMIADENTTLNIDHWLGDSDIYGTNLIETLESYGSQQVRELLTLGAVPFTMIFDKGAGLVIEDIAEHIEGTIDLSSVGRSSWSEGQLRSTIIGPSNSWDRLVWDDETEGADISEVRLYGSSSITGSETLIRVAEGRQELDLSRIDAELYPFLRLEYEINDADRSASQLDHWRILHPTLPDAALFTSADEPFILSDTINAGEDLILDFNLLNISTTRLDPILVRYRLTDQSGQSTVFVKRAEAIPANGKINFSETIQTDGLGGMYRLTIELNPNQDPYELSMLNNFGQTEVFIRPDEFNPFLDVTFNGRTISNGEAVGHNPQISISLRDPSSFVLLDNPEDFAITLMYPEFLERRITEIDPDVTFVPAESLDENIASFLINPNLSIEGIYTLIVNAKDKAGNVAGTTDYRVQFEVRSDIEESPFKVWPVPFVEELNVQFTLGETLPDVFNLTIYNARGQLIKRVNIEDFGPLQTGLNRYQWDGLDQSGQPVQNGMYYYEVINNLQKRSERWKGSILKMTGQ
jgi:hypothetical protein